MTLGMLKSLRIPLVDLDTQRGVVAELEDKLSLAEHMHQAIQASAVVAESVPHALLRSAFQ